MMEEISHHRDNVYFNSQCRELRGPDIYVYDIIS